jgi:hypothetical protein
MIRLDTNFKYDTFRSWEKDEFCKYRKKEWSDTIYTLDIEVTSLFKINDVWQPFIYDDSIDYSVIEHRACPYSWQFGVEGHVLYGREFKDLKKVFKWMSNPFRAKVIYVFNLSYESGFLLDVLEEYHITDMTARDVRKPIQFYVKELNIYFRCAFMLTNMSLDVAAKEYTDVRKESGEDYNYNVARSPVTSLTEKEKQYMKMDIITLWKVIDHFRTEYKHIAKIPLTSTSIVRRAVLDTVDFYYIQHQWSLIPEPAMYLREVSIFAGGYTHANILRAGKIWKEQPDDPDSCPKGVDEASEYPSVMVLDPYPSKRFIKCKIDDFYKHRDTHAFFLYVKFDGVRSKFYNHYIQQSKSINLRGAVFDNGRIARCDHVELWLTDVDYDVITSCYDIKNIEIIEAYKSYKQYLDVRIIKFILDLYGKKTSLKGLEDPQSKAMYKAVKPQINGLYGCSARNIIKEMTEFYDKDDKLHPNEWGRVDWNDLSVRKQFIEDKLEEAKESWSTLFQYVIGCWVSAYSRRNLFMTLTGHLQRDDGSYYLYDKTMDRDVMYCDTDSIKFVGNHTKLIQKFNQHIVDKMHKVVDKHPDLNIEMYMPKDRKGIKHPIGFFEDDGRYPKGFITLGAKKYAYYDEEGELHITVSGVAKSGVSILNNDITKFKNGLKWGYADSGKLVHYYIDDQEPFEFRDYQGNLYRCTQKHAVVLQPTTYTLGLTDWYEYLLDLKNRRYFNSFRSIDKLNQAAVDPKMKTGGVMPLIEGRGL